MKDKRPVPSALRWQGEVRRLGHVIAAIADHQLVKVVAALDHLSDRRELDRLLDPARPRLRRLRPPRPITFARLLFLPLDGAIIDARHWRRQPGQLPRSALLPLAAAIRRALGAEAELLEAKWKGANFTDLAAVERGGLLLWQRAAECAPTLTPAPEWAASGLSEADFLHCRQLAGGVWRHARPLWYALAAAPHGPPEPLVEAAITAAAGEAPGVGEAILATLLRRAARPGSTVTAAAHTLPTASAERMLDRWIATCTPEISAEDPHSAANLIAALAEAIDDIAASPAAARPERRQALLALRQRLGKEALQAFNEGTEQKLLLPLRAGGGRLCDARATALEDEARAFKRLERAGRRLGGGAAFDSALRRIAEHLAAARAAGGNPIDLARLAEILIGPEAGLPLLEGS